MNPTFSVDRVQNINPPCEYVRLSVQTGLSIFFLDMPSEIVTEICEGLLKAAKGSLGNYGLVSKKETAS